MTVRFAQPGKTAAAVDYLRSRISSGEWTINSRIPKEPELMESIGVGKSTLREAVRSLVIVGMLEPIRGVGTFVRSRTPVDGVITSYLSGYPTRDVLGYRAALEIEAARQAAINRTHEQLETLRALLHDSHNVGAEHPLPRTHDRSPGNFHDLVFEAAGNGLLRDLYAAVIATIRDKKRAGQLPHADDAAQRSEEHAAIVEAIANRDADAAAQAMIRHVGHDILPVPSTLVGDDSSS